MKKIAFIFVAAMLLVFSACGGDEGEISQPALAQTAQATTGVETESTTLTVWGMMCGSCERRVSNVLSGIDGVVDFSVNSRTDTVVVEHLPTLDVSVIENAITAEGFDVQ